MTKRRLLMTHFHFLWRLGDQEVWNVKKIINGTHSGDQNLMLTTPFRISP